MRGWINDPLLQSQHTGCSPEPVQTFIFGTVTAYTLQPSASSPYTFWYSQSTQAAVLSQFNLIMFGTVMCLGCSPQPVQFYTVWYSHSIQAAVISQFNHIVFCTVTVCRLQSWASSTLYCFVQSQHTGCSHQQGQPYIVLYSHCV